MHWQNLYLAPAYRNFKFKEKNLCRVMCNVTEGTGRSKSLCAPDDYSTKHTQKYFKHFQSLILIPWLELGITDGVSVSLVTFCIVIFSCTETFSSLCTTDSPAQFCIRKDVIERAWNRAVCEGLVVTRFVTNRFHSQYFSRFADTRIMIVPLYICVT
jgi:hypothetical protein